jgi:hypothetical protein
MRWSSSELIGRPSVWRAPSAQITISCRRPIARPCRSAAAISLCQRGAISSSGRSTQSPPVAIALISAR